MRAPGYATTSRIMSVPRRFRGSDGSEPRAAARIVEQQILAVHAAKRRRAHQSGVFGRSHRRHNQSRAKTSMMFQTMSLSPWRTIIDRPRGREALPRPAARDEERSRKTSL